jgi:hypothetical protein
LIISHSRRFIFVKTAKTGGTSLETFLARHCSADDIVTPVYPAHEGHCPRNYSIVLDRFRSYARERSSNDEGDGERPNAGAAGDAAADASAEAAADSAAEAAADSAVEWLEHLPASVLRTLFPDEWERYFTFCVERNPWDKLVSGYHDHRHRTDDPELTFDRYFPIGLKMTTGAAHYTDGDGRLIVDRVLRYEALEDELGDVCSLLGVPYDGRLAERAKDGYRPPADDYRRYFDDAQRRRVAKRFRWEIDHLGYAF